MTSILIAVYHKNQEQNYVWNVYEFGFCLADEYFCIIQQHKMFECLFFIWDNLASLFQKKMLNIGD